MTQGTIIREQVRSGLVQAAIATSGGPLIGYVQKPGGIDRTTDPPTIAQPTETPVAIVQSAFTDLDRASGAVSVQDLKFLMEAGPVEPTNSDHLRVGDKVYEIVNPKAIAPGGEPLMWIIQARR